MEFVCIRCNKTVPYKLISDEMNETCYKCIEEIKEKKEQARKRKLKKQFIRRRNLKILLKSIQKGIKGMAFIEFGNYLLLHVDNILSFRKKRREKEDEEGNVNVYYDIIILTRDDNKYKIHSLSKTQCEEKWNEIKTIISTEQKIYAL